MSRFAQLVIMSALVLGLAAPSPARAAVTDTMACNVQVTYTLNNTTLLSYVKDFQVGVDAPFSDDFSSAIRFRFFDAFLTIDNGLPVVSIAFDADVSVFNAVAFGDSLPIHDHHGETRSGNSAFFSSSPFSNGSHRTSYTLTCARAN